MLLEQLVNEAYGAELAREVLASFERPRATTFRVNTLKAGVADVAAACDAAGIEFYTLPGHEGAFWTARQNDTALRETDVYKTGGIYVQNASAMLPAYALAPAAGEDILDMCAAPGGKTSQIAALSGNRANITACEKNPIRADKLRHNLELLGARRINVMQTDARKLDDFFTFDKVLLDAPCSGSGTLHAGESSGFSGDLYARVQGVQRELLRRALAAVKVGGYVVYSTCSILPAENEQAVADALNPAWAPHSPTFTKKRGKVRGGKHKVAPFRIEAEVVPLEFAGFDFARLPCKLEGAVVVKPSPTYEGFFICALKRTR